jgi:hypothetical protein
VGPRAVLDLCGKSLLHRDSILCPPSPVAIPTELFRPLIIIIIIIIIMTDQSGSRESRDVINRYFFAPFVIPGLGPIHCVTVATIRGGAESATPLHLTQTLPRGFHTCKPIHDEEEQAAITKPNTLTVVALAWC